MTNQIDDNFRKVFINWIDNNWTDTDKELAIFLKVSPQHLSNIKTGARPCGEKTRQKICRKIGIDYKSLFGTGDSEPSNVIKIISNPKVNPRLEKMHNDLDSIYGSGDTDLIAATETNLASFKTMVQMKKRASKKEALSLAEEGESLLNLPASKEKSGRNS